MVFFWVAMTVFALECLLSYWWLRRMWHRLRHPFWRALIVAGAAGVGLSMAWLIASRTGWLPEVRAFGAVGMVWSLLAVPFGVIPCLFAWMIEDAVRAFKKMRLGKNAEPAPAPQMPHSPPHAFHWTRRQLLGAGLAGSPLALTYAATGVGLAQAWDFRRRRLRVPVPGLPAALEGLRILHVSDTHVGGFTPADNLDRIAQAVAEEKPDLIAFTGDLVDHTNRALPAALVFCEKLRAIAPVFFCEGNHDRIDNAATLRAQLHQRGFDWLVDGDSRTLTLRGQRVQVLGASWSFKLESHAAAVAQAAARRDPGAFPLLLIHHPDAFDAAAQAGFPLVLAGHTHGGQLMLSERLGAGSVMFNYWSGLYRKPGASLVVSNGVGNWFPLRVNAPAEIGVLELRGG